MKIVLMTVGKTTTEYLRKGIEMYTARINRYMQFELNELPDIRNTKSLTEAQQKEREGELILSALQPSDAVVLLDERGREMTSREFADDIDRYGIRGTKRLVYIVGGPYGFSAKVYDRANAKLSLSRMTYPHEMVRLFFTEQIYRAMTILRGEPYHHD
ncbi:MAG: 23S rRNA (pseudouridine(1915)-N(3))-methyltransferase RlmH [Paramuribaculum sp.]|nr:23S rRNA (pseudouridine(1915)-N(3))-methyltransferase RlmH [Bacteroidales bacterium]MDE7449398.1 23S rRNA (pseudouridine(1915)-N(3))-methyltransferase RlmH [Paramuribaculum sp.]